MRDSSQNQHGQNAASSRRQSVLPDGLSKADSRRPEMVPGTLVCLGVPDLHSGDQAWVDSGQGLEKA